MQNKIKWVENMVMLATSSSGHSMILDGPPALGGENLGIRPMEMLLLGLGGCTTVDVISILKKMRQDVSNCEVFIDSERSPKYPKIFTSIHLNFTISGNNLEENKVQKAIDLSAEKYCSAAAMLGALAKITHSFTVQ